jgi:hypothetical protein
MQSGELDLSRLDIGKLGQKLMSSLTAEELQQFEGSSTGIYASIAKVSSIMQRQIGSNFDIEELMRKLGDLQGTDNGGGGSMDVASVVQTIGASLAPNLGPELQSSVTALLQGAGGNPKTIQEAQEMLRSLSMVNTESAESTEEHPLKKLRQI